MKKFRSLIIAISIVLAVAIALSTGLVLGTQNIGAKTIPQQEVIPKADTFKGELIGGIYYATAEEETGASEAPITEKGAIYVNDGATVTIGEDAVISGHESLYGGAIYVAGGGTLIVNGGRITNNTSRLGGAIYVESGGTVEFKKENELGQATTGGIITENYSEAIDNAIGDAGEQTAAVYAEYGANIITPANCSINNNIAQDYGYYIIYHVDGVESRVSTGYEEIGAFNLSDAPLDYEHCCGYFTNRDMITSVEDQDDVIYETYTTANHRTFRKFNGLYTKTATPEKLSFELNSDNQTYNVGQINTTTTTGDIVIPREVTKNDIKGAVTVIYSASYYSDGAFYSNTNITTVYMPNTITTIGEYAFRDCIRLTSVTIGSGVTNIGDYAFYGCYGLTEIVNKSSINITAGSYDNGYVAEYAQVVINKDSDMGEFAPSNGIIYYTNSNVEDVGKLALGLVDRGATTITIDNDCTKIKRYAFRGCTGFTELTIPSGVTGVGEYAFPSNLATINYDGSIEDWFGMTFESNWASGWTLYINNQEITDLEVPNSVTIIPANIFYGCTGLTSITIPSCVTSVGDFAFSYCNYLTEINWNTNLMTSLTSNSDIFCNAGASGSGISVIFGNNVQSVPAYLFSVSSLSRLKIINVTLGENITSIGDYAFYYCSGITGTLTIPSRVTDIGDSAFRSCTGITGITIPNSVRSIGASAFSSCKRITEIIIPSGVTSIGASAFSGCIGLTNITISNSVTSIGYSAFSNCTYLTQINWDARELTTAGSELFAKAGIDGNGVSVIFGRNVQSIPERLFYTSHDAYKPKITSVTIGEKVVSIGDSAFSHCTGLTSITFPDSMTSIGAGAFYGCNNLTEITIPVNVTSVGDWAFADCRNLTEINWNAKKLTTIPTSDNCIFNYAGYNGSGIVVTFGETVESIPAYLFYVEFAQNSKYEPKIINVTIGGNVTSIGTRAFSGCTGLTEITIPESVTNIGTRAFSACDHITNINWNASELTTALTRDSRIFYYVGRYGGGVTVTFGENVQSIPAYLFYGANNSSEDYIKSVTIGENVTSIGDYAFHYCLGLNNITIPDSVISIGDYAFCDCRLLEYAIFGNGLRSIGDYAFYCCKFNCVLTIPDGVTSIGANAFAGCELLADVLTIPESVTSIGEYAFAFCYWIKGINWNVRELTTELTSRSYIFNYAGTKGNGITVTFGESVRKIPDYLFYNSYSSDRPKITSVIIGSNVTSIGYYAFRDCSVITSVTFENTTGWYVTTSASATSGTAIVVTNTSTNATNLKSTYSSYYWKRNAS